MNQDEYKTVINGSGTYKFIGDTIVRGDSVFFAWTDEAVARN